MAVSPEFLEFVEETLAPLGDIAIKRMFGAAGVYCGDLFFAVVDDDTLYLKADARNREAYEEAGLSRATIRNAAGETTPLNFYAAPEAVFEDEAELRCWTGLALDAARRAAARKAGRGRKAR